MPLLSTPWHLSWFCIHCEKDHFLRGPHCRGCNNDKRPLFYAPWSLKSTMCHYGITELSCFVCILWLPLGGWRHNWEGKLFCLRFALCPSNGSLQGWSGRPTLWNPLLGHNIETFPQFFSPWWCLPVVEAPGYPLVPRTVWLPNMWACSFGGVRFVVLEG